MGRAGGGGGARGRVRGRVRVCSVPAASSVPHAA